jgi:hypothetical protein
VREEGLEEEWEDVEEREPVQVMQGRVWVRVQVCCFAAQFVFPPLRHSLPRQRPPMRTEEDWEEREEREEALDAMESVEP